MKNKGLWFRLIYQLMGATLFTLGILYLPLPWWHKLLLWLGAGMLVNKLTDNNEKT